MLQLRSIQFCLLLLVLIPLRTFAQNQSELDQFNREREKISRTGMYVLGGWAIGNFAYSGISYNAASGTEKHFHEMNMLWNSVNLALAGGSLLAKNKSGLGLRNTLKGQNFTEKMFLANAALDLVYCSAGLYLTERSKSETVNRDRFYGWGESLVLQGGFLFLFDSTMCFLHNRHGKRKLMPLLDKVQIGTSGLGLKIGIQL